jgi:AraC family transcriptional regulator
VEEGLPTLLKCVPDDWGPKFGTDCGAVTRTQTGPNKITFKAPAHMALVMFAPQPNREVSLNSDRKTVVLAPVGAIEVIPAEAELFARWRVAKENLLVAFDPSRLTQLAGAEFQNEDFEFQPPKPGFVDPQALLLANLIRSEFQREETANELCFDALITLFGTHLLRTYSSFRARPNRLFSGGLSPKAWRSVTDYIHANLSQNLCVSRLAAVAGLSPSHFLRVFHRTCGLTPHQYVVAERLTLVERLAKTTDMPLAAIAKAAGFSSNSHMTATMQRLRGTAPTDLRRIGRTSAS